mgnify:FL=1
MTKLKIVYMDPRKLTPYENNPRENNNTVPYLMNSISEFGFLIPVVVDSDGIIIAGHTRIKAALELGLKEVPTICASDLTKKQADAFRLIDNKINEQSWWDQDKLREEMDKLDVEWENFGFEPLPDMEDIPVWDGDGGEELSEAPSEASCDECRLLVIVPEGIDASEVENTVTSLGCKVKVLDRGPAPKLLSSASPALRTSYRSISRRGRGGRFRSASLPSSWRTACRISHTPGWLCRTL